jgi:hypothetical protein
MDGMVGMDAVPPCGKARVGTTSSATMVATERHLARTTIRVEGSWCVA